VILLGPLYLALSLLCASCAWESGPMRTSGQGPAPSFVFYPGPPEEPRIQHLATYTSEKDVVGEMSAFRKFVLGERDYAELGKPYGVAIHEGKLFVCDTREGAVVIFDLTAGAVELMGNTKRGRLSKPINIAVDPDGTRYVADTGLRRVMVYDRNNHFLRALGDPDRWKPSDLVIVGDRLYVTDLLNGQVVVLQRQGGQELRRLSRKGSGDGELFLPTNIDVDADGSLYVADTGNFRVLKLDHEGTLVQQFGSLGTAHGRFARPKGIAVDREGRLYVVDAAFENVQIFDRNGKLLLFFGGAGNSPGRLNLPAKVAIDYGNVELFADAVAPGYKLEYLILVSSQFGRNKINIYGFLEKSENENEQRHSRRSTDDS
jgi:sugar lactone lactonase YvrE